MASRQPEGSSSRGTGLGKGGPDGQQDLATRINHQYLPTKLLGSVVWLQLRLIKLPWQVLSKVTSDSA
jgi:hypothetical protein